MPMPGGPMGGGGPPMGGGPQPMPKPPGQGGIGGGRPWQQFMGDSGDRMDYQRNSRQGGVDQAMMDLRRAQIMGADPMVLARLEQEANQAQRGFDQWQQEQYVQGMSDMSQRGPGAIGQSGPGQSQREQNPYLQMLLQSQLGMGGGRGGSPMGGLGGIGRG